MMERFSNASGRILLDKMISVIRENKGYLSEIDGQIGDGDHGFNMDKGFRAYEQQLDKQKITFSVGLDGLGTLLLTEIGGSMGPIYGTLFMGMAEPAKEADQIDGALFGIMLRNALEALKDIIEARIGDKTLMDTLIPAVEAYEEAFAEKGSFDHALYGMKSAARRGAESTKELVAQFGRSSRLGERSRGTMDAGAVSCCLLLEAIADGISQLLNQEAER